MKLCILLQCYENSFVAGGFDLSIEPGQFTDSEIIVLLGENGTGKTTFIKMLAGRLEPDGGGNVQSILGLCFS